MPSKRTKHQSSQQSPDGIEPPKSDDPKEWNLYLNRVGLGMESCRGRDADNFKRAKRCRIAKLLRELQEREAAERREKSGLALPGSGG